MNLVLTRTFLEWFYTSLIGFMLILESILDRVGALPPFVHSLCDAIVSHIHVFITLVVYGYVFIVCSRLTAAVNAVYPYDGCSRLKP